LLTECVALVARKGWVPCDVAVQDLVCVFSVAR
jgi:hypothetical protein